MKITGTGKLVATLLLAAVLGYGAYYGWKNKKAPAIVAPAAVEQTTPALVQPAAPAIEPKVVQNEEVVVKKKSAPKKTPKVSHRPSGGHSTTGSSNEVTHETLKKEISDSDALKALAGKGGL